MKAIAAQAAMKAVAAVAAEAGYSYYTIKATAGAGGSISPSGNVSVREGRAQTFTITPDKGYAVSNVKIDGKSIGAVKSYTFKNVTSDQTIRATFALEGRCGAARLLRRLQERLVL